MKTENIIKDRQYYKFCLYGFLKNLRFFDAFFVLFLLEKGMLYTQIGILYAAREIIIHIFELPSGIIADTYGRKKSLAISFVIYIFSFLIFYFFSNFWFFLLAFSLYGIADAFRSGTHKGMIMEYLRSKHREHQKIAYYGHTRAWSQRGSALSALIAGLLVLYGGSYHYIFLFSIVPYLINLFLILSYPGELDFSPVPEMHKHSRSLGTTFRSFFTIIRNPKILHIINTSAVHSAFLKAVKDYIQPLMLNIALITPVLLQLESTRKNGIIIGILYFFIYIATSYASRFSYLLQDDQRRNIPYLTLVAGFISGILSGIFYVNHLWVLSLLAFIAIFIIENIRKPVLTGYVAEHTPPPILTSVISAQSLLKTLFTVLLSLLLGVLADRLGVGKAILYSSLSLLLATLILRFRLGVKH